MDDDGALEPLPPEVAEDLPGRVRGFIWPTEFLMLADFLEATPHSHSALQLMVGIERPIRMDFGNGWIEVPGALVGTDVDHGFDGSAGLMGGGWIEAESRVGRALTDGYLSSRPWYGLTEDEAGTIGTRLAPCLERSMTCEDAHRRWRRGLEVLAPAASEEPPIDERIRAVLGHLRRTPTPPPSVDRLMEIAHLSRTTRRMNGVTPSEMEPIGAWLSSCR